MLMEWVPRRDVLQPMDNAVNQARKGAKGLTAEREGFLKKAFDMFDADEVM
jgi:hypothetical protein